MNDRPPQVDFSRPVTELQLLSLERERIRSVVQDIQAATSDIGRYGAEGARYAEIAAMWGATLMVAEICKLGLAAGDRRAKVLFNAQDKLVGQANKVLKGLGRGTIATKEDILKTLDPELRGVSKMTESVQKVRGFLKSVGVTENKETKLVLDLTIAMTQDTLLMMQAMNLEQQALSNAQKARAKMRESLARVSIKLLLVDSEITRAIERLEQKTRTA